MIKKIIKFQILNLFFVFTFDFRRHLLYRQLTKDKFAHINYF